MTRPGESDMRVYVTLADMTPDVSWSKGLTMSDFKTTKIIGAIDIVISGSESSENEKKRQQLQFSSNDSAETFGGIAESRICRRRAHVFRFWVEINSRFGGRKIEAGLRWKSVTMNQSEIDDLSR
ncbi:hypothetical protein LXL04_008423 [Taraxacum kok-saghyz]